MTSTEEEIAALEIQVRIKESGYLTWMPYRVAMRLWSEDYVDIARDSPIRNFKDGQELDDVKATVRGFYRKLDAIPTNRPHIFREGLSKAEKETLKIAVEVLKEGMLEYRTLRSRVWELSEKICDEETVGRRLRAIAKKGHLYRQEGIKTYYLLPPEV